MNQRSVPSKLVNFRLPTALLEPFDDVCLLSGKTRTQVLSALIFDHVANVSPTIVNEISVIKRNAEELRNMVMKSADRQTGGS